MADTPQEEAQESTQLFETLKRSGFKGRDAHYTIQIIRDMASANLIHRFESEMHAMRAENTTTRWMIGIGFTVLAVLISVLGFILS